MFDKPGHIFTKTHETLWKMQVCTVEANYLWNHNSLLNLQKKKKKKSEGQFDMYNFQIVISMNMEPSRQELHKQTTQFHSASPNNSHPREARVPWKIKDRWTTPNKSGYKVRGRIET